MAAAGIDGAWIASNPDAANPVLVTHMRGRFPEQRPGPGQTVATAPKLWFLMQQEGANVVGTFHDEKVFTCELKGTLAGGKLSINWETVFHWLNIHENGSAELALSPDGSTLAGRFVSGSVSAAWRLTREDAQARAAPAPVAPPAAAAPPAPPVQSRPIRSPPSTRSPDPPPFSDYHSRIAKDVWDAERDEQLLKRLKKRARVEPELRERLIRRGLLDPKER